MKYVNKTCITAVLLLLFLGGVHGQMQSKSALTYHIGKGNSDAGNLAGDGFFVGAGYQQRVWIDRLRFNPTIKIGSYNSKMYIGSPDKAYSSILSEVPLFFDVIRYKSIAIFVGTGGVLKKSDGLIGNGGGILNSYYIHRWNYGIYAGCGISFNPPKSCFFVQFQPLNYYFLNRRTDFFSSIGFGLKLPNSLIK